MGKAPWLPFFCFAQSIMVDKLFGRILFYTNVKCTAVNIHKHGLVLQVRKFQPRYSYKIYSYEKECIHTVNVSYF